LLIEVARAEGLDPQPADLEFGLKRAAQSDAILVFLVVSAICVLECGAKGCRPIAVGPVIGPSVTRRE
jgi:hypothetical protein